MRTWLAGSDPSVIRFAMSNPPTLRMFRSSTFVNTKVFSFDDPGSTTVLHRLELGGEVLGRRRPGRPRSPEARHRDVGLMNQGLVTVHRWPAAISVQNGATIASETP